MTPEYLSLFSNPGPMNIEVELQDHDGSIPPNSMWPNEIIKLLSADNHSFVTEMTFDEWPFEIIKYEIDPSKNTLVIRARKAK